MAANPAIMGQVFHSRLPVVLFGALVSTVVVGINGWVLVDFLQEHLPQVRTQPLKGVCTAAGEGEGWDWLGVENASTAGCWRTSCGSTREGRVAIGG